jgi:dTDP-4-dehydrorhamnose reductase
MKILLFGAGGQVGWQLQRSLAVLGHVTALDVDSSPLCGDLRDADGVGRTVRTVAPDVVVNAAAYTAVDRAEDEPELAFAVNARSCEALARAAEDCGAWLVHYSTDYVYDGSGTRPWLESDPAAPLNTYGRSKLAGDLAIAREASRHLILRTSWVFDSRGGNFARSILKAAMARETLQVVNDQWGAPTRASLIADVTAHALRKAHASGPQTSGVYHLAAAGETNWHVYATLLLAEAARFGLGLRAKPEAVEPIGSASYPTRARRPANSRLDTGRLRQAFGIHLPPWQDGVRAVAAELAVQHL